MDSQGWNRYSYVGNRALSGRDPTGFVRDYVWVDGITVGGQRDPRGGTSGGGSASLGFDVGSNRQARRERDSESITCGGEGQGSCAVITEENGIETVEIPGQKEEWSWDYPFPEPRKFAEDFEARAKRT